MPKTKTPKAEKKTNLEGSEMTLLAGPIDEDEPTPELATELDTIEEFIGVMTPRVRSDGTDLGVFDAIREGKWSRKVIMLTPFNRPINPHAHFAMMAHLRKNPWMGYDYETDTVIQRARNFLAHRFLASEADWSWWVDQDTVAPFGSPGTFYNRFGANAAKFPEAFAGLSALPRLLAANKTIVGGVYAQRKPNGKLVIQPDLHPRNDEDVALALRIRQDGPKNEVVKVGYVATGCALIHRKVYEDIKKTHPELAPKEDNGTWDFFGHDTNRSGEDIHFCKLAHDAGHESWLDLGLHCAHLGQFAYLP